MPIWFLVICAFSIIACAAVGGIFLTFSDFVMRSLNRADTAAGIEVMQVINREVFRTVFMVLLLGMTALSVLLVGYANLYLDGPASTMIMAGGVIYLVGVFAVTAVFNVPMNKALDAMGHSAAEAASYWETVYFPDWTMWNWVRAVASSASAVCYLGALVWMAQGAI